MFEISGKTLIQNATLHVSAGEAVCLCGPSGIGKTTLLEIAAGLTKPSGGTMTLHSKKIGCTFQDDILVPWLTAMDNLLLVMNGEKTDNHENASQWLENFALAPSSKPTKMSGGMRRRLALARAFTIGPKILLLDEPFAFLDDKWQESTAKHIENARMAGCAVLLVSHQMHHMQAIDCRTITIQNQPIEIKYPRQNRGLESVSHSK